MNLQDLVSTADQYIKLREERRALDKVVEEMKTREATLKALVMSTLKEQNANGVGATQYTFTVVRKESPQVTDWPKLYAHIQATGEFEYLQRRLSPPAVNERRDAGIAVPGVEYIPFDDLSITKLKG